MVNFLKGLANSDVDDVRIYLNDCKKKLMEKID